MSYINISIYLEKYSIFYLSKYSVTERKFAEVLKKKITKDFLSKKLTRDERDHALDKVSFFVSRFSNMKLINENIIIKNRIANLIRKGFSIKKIFFTLKSDRFGDKLIKSEMDEILKEENIDLKLIHTFSQKKRLGCYDKNWNYKNKTIYKRSLNKLLNNGFGIETCKLFLERSKNDRFK